MSRLRSLIHTIGSIGARPGDSADLRNKKRILALTLSFSLIPSSLFALYLFSLGAAWAAAALALIDLTVIGLLLGLARRPKSLSLYFQVLCLVNSTVSITITLLFGGILASGINILWGLLSPLAAIIGLNRRAAWFWMGVFCFGVALCATLPAWLPGIYQYPPGQAEISAAWTVLTVTLFFFTILDNFIRQRDIFRRRSDDLLRNILPDEIAERLKEGPGLIADHYEETSVLFADVVGFTPMSAKMSPAELVALLNEVFTVFDALTEARGLEKIKTIGDCYMVAAGVPRPRLDHAQALADLALEMRSSVESRDFGGRRLAFRIGIHSGPVVAGVIGTHKFIYDLWGDAVNTASRMESHGQGGVIQVTEQTYERIQGEFNCASRGVIEVKGKGEMSVWEILGRRDADHAG